MSIQELFYLVAIIFMLVLGTVVIGIGILFLLIYRRVTQLQRYFFFRINKIAQPAELAMNVGVNLVEGAARRISTWFGNGQKRN